MFGSNIKRHINEFRQYVSNHKYEKTDGGIYFPQARAHMQGVYTHNVNGLDEQSDHNIIPDEGLNHILNVILKSGSQITSWFVGIHSGSGTPAAALTAATYHSTLVEVSTTYDEATREAWVGDAVDTVNTEVTNDATPATFTMNNTQAVNGAAILSVSTKQSTSGTLLSAGKFTATRNLVNTDVFNLKYKIDLDAV